MDYDLILTVGLLFLCLAVLSFLAARADDRSPVVSGGMALTGLCLSAWGMLGIDHAIGPADLPDVVFTVLGRYVF